MPKRPDTSETLHFALELLKRIPRGRKISGPELQTQLSGAGLTRNLRTIQRQLEMLSEHFDIERDERTKPYGYRWKENSAGLSLPGLSEQESLLLALAEQHLKNLLPASLMKSMEGFFYQARTKLQPTARSERPREWLSKVRVVSTTQPLLPPKIATGVFEAVSNALYGNCWLAIDYKNAAGQRTKANVMPLGLAQQGSRLYLVCRYEGYENERSLALNRILAAQVSTLTFVRPSDFDLQQYDDNGHFGFGEGKRISLTFRITKDAGFHLLESRLSADQEVKELQDAYEITATVVETVQLDQWLRGFGEQVSKISRKSAGDELAEVVRR